MKIYRIYTEDKGNLPELASRYFDGFTILKATGYWKGKPEASIVIEIIVDLSKNCNDDFNVHKLAHLIKDTNHQETVIITCQDIEVVFV